MVLDVVARVVLGGFLILAVYIIWRELDIDKKV